MDKAKSARDKLPRVLRALSLGALLLGIGCVSWAFVNIEGQSVPPADAHSALPTGSSTTFAVGEGDIIGSLSIPVLEQAWPIIQGTGTNDLKRGVGHVIQSAMPGGNDNCVLSGHRDTVFTKLGKLKIGDEFIVMTSTGTYTYKISHVRIVDKDDTTVIVHTSRAVLTVTTCYPFHFFGSAPDRYIISADLVALR
jgi:sortase A